MPYPPATKTKAPSAANHGLFIRKGWAWIPAWWNWETTGICTLLVVLVFLIYGQTSSFEFLQWDDDQNIYAKPQITSFISPQRLLWAFTPEAQFGRWGPLAVVARQVNCQMFGLWAGGHHLVNAFMHALNAVMLFFALRALTGFTWRNVFIAAVFAVHPLRVEVVGWATQLNELLSGFFFILTLWSYALYARKPDGKLHYWLSILWCALGLLSKPNIITLPCVLLLLDYWPLNRLGKVPLRRLFLEKIPYFLLAGVTSVICQKLQIKMAESDHFTTKIVIQNAVFAYSAYLWQTIWPVHLLPSYPFPSPVFSIVKVGVFLAMLSVITIAAFGVRKRYPFLIIGWLWFIGILVPTTGLLSQFSKFAHADRYMYLPQIGLLFAGTWMVADWAGKNWSRRGIMVGVVASVICIILGGLSYEQASYWHDGVTLLTHTLECTQGSNNWYANYQLAVSLQYHGRNEEAMEQSRKVRLGQCEEAIGYRRETLRFNPDDFKAHNELGNLLWLHGEHEEAIAQIQKALYLQPANLDVQNTLALMLSTAPQASLRNGSKAVELATQAIQSSGNGNNPFLLRTLAAAYAEEGDFPKAVQTAQDALRYTDANNADFGAEMQREIKLYAAGQALRDGR